MTFDTKNISNVSNTTTNEEFVFNNQEIGEGEGNTNVFNIGKSPITGGIHIESTDHGAVESSLDLAGDIVKNARASSDSASKVTGQALEALRSIFPTVASEKIDDKTLMLVAFGVGVLGIYIITSRKR